MKNILHNICIRLFFLILIFDTSCRDENDSRFTSIEGQVMDYYTSDPLPSIRMVIEKCEYNLITPSICNVFNTIYSDNSGYFQSELDYSSSFLDGIYFQMIVLQSDHYSNGTFHDIKLGETNVFEFKLKPLRILKITLVDSSMLYSKISIQVKVSNTDSCTHGDSYYCFQDEQEILNLNETQFIYFKIVPETKLTISWTCIASDNNLEYKHQDSYFENQDTSSYRIVY